MAADGPGSASSATVADTLAESDHPSTGDDRFAGSDPRGRRWPPMLSAVVGVALVVWGVQIGLQPLGDNSFFTHLATGRLILADGLPTTDPYSFTAPDQPWVVQSWLASVLYAGSERLFDVEGIRILIAATTGALAGLVWLLTRPATTLIPRVLIAGIAAAIGSVVWTERPLLFGLLFMALVLTAARGHLHPAWLVPVFWLWVNTHGSWPLGIVVAVLLLAGTWLDDRRRPDRETRLLAFVLLGAILGGLNPLGPRLLIFPLELLERQDVLQFIVEWRSPSFTSVWSRIYLVQVAIAVVALMRRPSWRNALLLLVFVPASLLSARNIAVASLVLIPGMAAGLAGLGTIDGRRRSSATAVGSVALLALGAALMVTSLSGKAFDFGGYPTGPMVWLSQQGAWNGEHRVATNDLTGNLLEGIYGPAGVVFFDDRYDMYPMDVIDGVIEMEVAGLAWEDFLEKHEIEVLIWPDNKPLSTIVGISEEWRIVLADDDGWVVACHRDRGCDTLTTEAPL